MPQQIIFSKSVELKLDSIALQIEDRYGLSARNNFLKEFFKMIRHTACFPDLEKIYREDICFLIIKKKDANILQTRWTNNVCGCCFFSS